jgi:ABC-type nitrate/sulfonate/bicarbonate transport system substrate-binding protein
MSTLANSRARQIALAVAAILGLTLISSRCGPFVQVSNAADSTQQSVSVIVKSNAALDPSVAGIIVGIGAGRFKREGLFVDLLAGRSDGETLDYVASTANSIGIANTYSLLLARARSVPVIAFAAAYQKSPIIFYTLAKSKTRSPEDFIDKIVGYQPDNATAVVYDALMSKNRVSRSRVKEIDVASDPALLANGTVDVLPGHIGQMHLFRRMGIDQYSIDPARFGVHAPGTVYFTTAEVLRSNPELIQRFLRGLIDGWELAYSDYAKSIPIITEVIGNDFEMDDIRLLMDQQREFLRPLGARIGELTREQWSFAQNDLLQQRRLSAPIDIDAAMNVDILSGLTRQRRIEAPQ